MDLFQSRLANADQFPNSSYKKHQRSAELSPHQKSLLDRFSIGRPQNQLQLLILMHFGPDLVQQAQLESVNSPII